MFSHNWSSLIDWPRLSRSLSLLPYSFRTTSPFTSARVTKIRSHIPISMVICPTLLSELRLTRCSGCDSFMWMNMDGLVGHAFSSNMIRSHWARDSCEPTSTVLHSQQHLPLSNPWLEMFASIPIYFPIFSRHGTSFTLLLTGCVQNQWHNMSVNQATIVVRWIWKWGTIACNRTV